MAAKTITIDLEAYELLSQHKRAGQSFSQVIKRLFADSFTTQDLKQLANQVRLSEETLDAIEKVVEDRASSPARVVDW